MPKGRARRLAGGQAMLPDAGGWVNDLRSLPRADRAATPQPMAARRRPGPDS